MGAKELSNFQLYAMGMDKDLPQDVSYNIEKEFRFRELTVPELDTLNLEYSELAYGLNNDITTTEKVLIILLPFAIFPFMVIHAIIANRHLRKNEKNKWKQHWNFVAFGHIFWTIILILMTDFILK